MGIPTNLGRFAVKAQASGWGTAETSFANANFLECAMSVPTPVVESLQAEVMRADWFATTRLAGGSGPIEVSLSMPLHGFSTASPVADPAEHPDALLLASVLGSSTSNGYQASDLTGGAIGYINVTGSTGVAAHVGHALLVPLSAGSHGVGWINDLDTSGTPDVYSFARDLPSAPASSGAIYGSTVLTLGPAQPTPYSLQWLGGAANVNYVFADCVTTSATITLNAREQPMLEVTIRSTGATATGSGGLPDPAALTDRPQLPAVLGANGARAIGASVELPGQVSIALTAEVADQVNYSGQGIAQFVVNKRSVELTQVSPAVATGATTTNDPASLASPGTALGAYQVDADVTPGRGLSVFFGNAVVKELQTLGDSSGLVAVTTMLEAAEYFGDATDTGSVTTPPANTAFRIAFL